LCACIRHPKSFPQSHLSNNFSYSLIARFTLDKFESLTEGRHRLLPGKRWSRFLRQPGRVDSPIQRTNHHEDAETIFG
jgi:hypothetical protein